MGGTRGGAGAAARGDGGAGFYVHSLHRSAAHIKGWSLL